MRLMLLTLLTGCLYNNLGEDTDDTADTADTAASSDTGVQPTAFDCTQASFFGDQPDFADAGTVIGRITAPSGTVPVAGAEVSVEVGLQRAWTLSAEAGCFRLELPPGEHQIAVAKSRYEAEVTFDVTTGRTVDLGSVPLDAGDAKVAVVHGEYDSVGRLIEDLGIPMTYFLDPDDLYADADALEDFDVVFANCGSAATTQNGRHYTEAHLDTLRAWVEAGGTLYASDWEYELIEGIAPEALNFADSPDIGPAGGMEATVLDRDIEALLGSDTASIHFDLSRWVVIDSVDQALPVIIGTMPGLDGTHPLAALHRKGEGRMIYTSFHNEHQLTADMLTILYEVILSL